MNVYDAAHNLAKAIKESEEYKKFKILDEEIHNVESLKDSIKEFEERQLELQTMQMMGQELDEVKLKETQELFESLGKNPKAAEYFQAEMILNQMMGDVSRILGDAMDFRTNEE